MATTFSDPCLAQTKGRRRIFWTTQIRACGEYTQCDNNCGLPGLVYEDGVFPGERTIVNDEWLLSLILNILNTKARSDLKCPTPMAIYGHWSESYRKDGLYIGSTLWNAANKKYVRIADNVKAIEAAVKADMAKLVALELASSVNVAAEYIGRGQVSILVEAVVAQNKHVLNLAGSFVSGAWVWQYPT